MTNYSLETLVTILTSGMDISHEESVVESENKARAEKIILFAQSVSEQVLLLAGFIKPKMVVIEGVHQMDRPYDPWSRNQMAGNAELPDEAPDDALEFEDGSLQLHNIPTSLDAIGDSPLAHEFVFCKRRVIEWDGKRDRVHRVLTYEETARFVLFWLAEKILQIIRKNEWDKVRQMPDLYDRLASIWTPKVERRPFVLIQELETEDEDSPSHHHYIGTIYAENIRQAAEKTGLRVIDEETTEDVIILEMTKRFAPKFRLMPERDLDGAILDY